MRRLGAEGRGQQGEKNYGQDSKVMKLAASML